LLVIALAAPLIMAAFVVAVLAAGRPGHAVSCVRQHP
jgi:hypothetical protein